MRLLPILAALLIGSAGHAQVRMVDGDTLNISGVQYRLWGIDAPEKQQVCNDGWAAGHAASQHLRKLVSNVEVRCEPRTTDQYGRLVAVCYTDGRDLGAELVRAGMALAFVRYSSVYVDDEAQAKALGLGLHAHDCSPPWDWRAQRR